MPGTQTSPVTRGYGQQPFDQLLSAGMRADFRRTCEYCGEPIGDDQPPQSKYCRRSHRQRAYEIRDAAKVKQLKRRVAALRRQVAAYDQALISLAQHPRYGREVHDILVKAYVPLREEPGWEQRLWRLTTDAAFGRSQ